jgi:hypothetical protein
MYSLILVPPNIILVQDKTRTAAMYSLMLGLPNSILVQDKTRNLHATKRLNFAKSPKKTCIPGIKSPLQIPQLMIFAKWPIT